MYFLTNFAYIETNMSQYRQTYKDAEYIAYNDVTVYSNFDNYKFSKKEQKLCLISKMNQKLK